jgi:hypothetical protein
VIRSRLAQLGGALGRAVEMLRAAQRVQEVAEPVLAQLAQAAGSELATYWTIDSEQPPLRAIATWSAGGLNVAARERDLRRGTASLSRNNAGQVWRSRKPLWSITLLFGATLSGSPKAGLYGGVWLPVKSDTAVYAVIELLGRALEPMTVDDLLIVERLGFRLGHALEELIYGNARLH